MPWKGTEGDDGLGRKALNQSRGDKEKKRHKKADRGARKKPSGISVEGSPCSRPTQSTDSPQAPDGEGDRAAALLVRPLLHSWAHTKKGPEERSLRLCRFLVQVRRIQTQARPRDGGSSAPLAPRPSRVGAGSSPASRRRSFSSSGRAKGWESSNNKARLRGDSAPSLNVAPVLGDVDAAAASRRHRCYCCPTPPTEGTARGRSAEVEGSLLFREHFGFSGRARTPGGPASAPHSDFGSFRKGRRKTGKLSGCSALSGGRKGGKKESGRWSNAVTSDGDEREASRFHLNSV